MEAALSLGSDARYAGIPMMRAPSRDVTKRLAMAAVAILVLFDVGLVLALWNSSSGHPLPASAATPRQRPSSPHPPSPQPSTTDTGPASPRATIELRIETSVAEPMETVRIEGRYPESERRTVLRVQRKSGHDWASFPLPTMTKPSGRFSTYVQLNEPGRSRLRVVAPQTGAVSNVVSLVIQ